MPGIAIAIAFLGYSVGYYGLTQVQSGNWGFLDLVVPSRWASKKDVPRDGAPGSGQSGSALGAAAAAAGVAAANAQGASEATPPLAGGTGYQPTGTGVVQGAGGITILYDPQGNPYCTDKNGNAVPCPAGTPTLTPN